ncbi:aspartyl-phosphate phosphatase Spo0E family protein [Crassaminicella thermophila]|uniref:Aspartyl-phosphate phosphatase Spo0E family protein n=1 Tax=Crassaminicella thermophila TaxID=2599308 RepID=A0A5C0SFQ6_CRATE|nr:aspartyl-phosphate phosphatase Spo0E family protein [Crassaminicella thermophila]QEK11680.1 aspartyl-phosphate phosphatase Spo0E family protein [Crassaminicella thermophila]QEK12593.1 aspartyl-phosphate phosphatase Spo0E family protein [Crassaminicella thermophila]QEK12732.1 aspartyl-phosphate phosphatase Spo0E family protein [Crassaminicella thermophila]
MDKYNNKLKSLLDQIEQTRFALNELIKHKEENLLDQEVIELSQLLDKLLSKYDSMQK